jgi:hypothetical protein
MSTIRPTVLIRAKGMGMKPFVRGATILSVALAAVASGLAGAQDGPVTKASTVEDWTRLGTLPDLTGVWQALGGPITPAGAPLTAAAAARLAKDRADRAKGTLQDYTSANCVPPGVPINMAMPYPIELLVTPGKVTMVMEAFSQIRHIYTDGRPLPEDPDLTYNGSSVGHWEKDALVVETVGLTDTELAYGMRHSEKLVIKERYRLTAPDKLEIVFTITDPSILSAPWTFTRNYQRRRDWVVREYVCAENNRHEFTDDGKAIIDLKP